MPTFTSVLLHIAAKGLFHVISFVCDTTYIDCSRRIDTMQVNPPRLNTTIKAYLCFVGIGRLFRTGNGKIAVHMSVTMLMLAFANLFMR